MINVLYLCGKNCFENDSIFNFLLKDINYKLISLDDNSKFLENVLIIYSKINGYITEDVDNFVKKINCPYILYHLSGEYNYGFYPKIKNLSNKEKVDLKNYAYGNAAHVFRNYYNPAFDIDNITHLPIFWQSGFCEKELSASDNRIYNSAFIGTLKNDRQNVVDIMKTIGDYYLHTTSGFMTDDKISIDKQIEIYSQSIICPCPMGGCHPEIFRFCEVLEAGSIPVIVEYFDFEYHYQLYGYNSPIPKIKYWEDLPKVIKDIKKRGVEKVTRQIRDWYKNYKIEIKKDFENKLKESL